MVTLLGEKVVPEALTLGPAATAGAGGCGVGGGGGIGVAVGGGGAAGCGVAVGGGGAAGCGVAASGAVVAVGRGGIPATGVGWGVLVAAGVAVPATVGSSFGPELFLSSPPPQAITASATSSAPASPTYFTPRMHHSLSRYPETPCGGPSLSNTSRMGRRITLRLPGGLFLTRSAHRRGRTCPARARLASPNTIRSVDQGIARTPARGGACVPLMTTPLR
jgi:hypothetical protein